jgi:cAMP-specific phosphodiesterase 4/high affinity cAMP-specific and IBMX-insensitive 3',5'-cyclic phosphodiesterase 8
MQAAAFQVLRQDSHNFLQDLQPKARALARRQIIDMVLATDMKQHFSQVSMFNTKFAAIIDSKQKGMYLEMPTDEDSRSMVLQV